MRPNFNGKKITLMGLGLLGRGLGDARFFAEEGAELIVTDLKSETELKPSLEKLKGFPNITYRLGGHRMEDFENRDLIMRAPNAPLDSPFLAHARERGISVAMDASLFAKLSPATIVGVTGTRGKSTVTQFIYEMARAAGKNPRLGGNVRDMATLPLLRETKAGDIVVLELDSWQLQGFEEEKIGPHIAVWTNFMPDHMNYYHGDMDRYFRDKAAIARFQKKDDYFVTNADIKGKIEAKFGPLHATCITNAVIPVDWEVSLPGEHNRHNAALAAAAAKRLDVPDVIIKNVLKNFHGLPGRMEFLGEKQGVAFFNDSNATTPDATIAALEALAATDKTKGRRIVLIAGGSDKALSFTDLAPVINRAAAKIVLFEGTATEKLRPLLAKSLPQEIVKDMPAAFTAARKAAKSGDIVLLSPAATSFGIFKNEYDRGDQFKALFDALK